MEATYGKADSGDNVTTANGTWLRDVEKDASAAAAKYFLLIAYPIVFVFGVCGNTLVITVILKFVLPRLLFRCCADYSECRTTAFPNACSPPAI